MEICLFLYCCIFALIICCLTLMKVANDSLNRNDKYAEILSLERINREKQILCILYRLKEFESFEKAGKDTATRNLINDEIAKHSSNLRLLEQVEVNKKSQVCK